MQVNRIIWGIPTNRLIYSLSIQRHPYAIFMNQFKYSLLGIHARWIKRFILYVKQLIHATNKRIDIPGEIKWGLRKVFSTMHQCFFSLYSFMSGRCKYRWKGIQLSYFEKFPKIAATAVMIELSIPPIVCHPHRISTFKQNKYQLSNLLLGIFKA